MRTFVGKDACKPSHGWHCFDIGVATRHSPSFDDATEQVFCLVPLPHGVSKLGKFDGQGGYRTLNFWQVVKCFLATLSECAKACYVQELYECGFFNFIASGGKCSMYRKCETRVQGPGGSFLFARIFTTPTTTGTTTATSSQTTSLTSSQTTSPTTSSWKASAFKQYKQSSM